MRGTKLTDRLKTGRLDRIVVRMAVTPLRERTRREIEQQAIVLFSEKGYQATSLQDIATAVGCSKATVLYHFNGKPAVLAAVLEQPASLVAALIEEMEQLAPAEARERTIVGFVELGVRYRGLLNLLNDVIPTFKEIPEFDGLVEVGSKLARLLAGNDEPQQLALAEFAIHGLLGACRAQDHFTDDALRELGITALRRLTVPPA
jgi:AcrR family transcriptional regulator